MAVCVPWPEARLIRRTFDKSLKVELARRALTQASVPEVLGLSATTLRSYIRGYRPLPDGFRERFHAAMDLVERAEHAAEQTRWKVLARGVS
ncbi:MAG: hypothetical protein F4018_14970 [Acidobacteria bacterium]|nr:hypothetical protein [Acidobacteriota bacterium]MYH30710.1 hypothetical protein [Acidobacteriota bacterium]MYK89525.1 hypothetical protein [Acidobacteriota bacterium]